MKHQAAYFNPYQLSLAFTHTPVNMAPQEEVCVVHTHSSSQTQQLDGLLTAKCNYHPRKNCNNKKKEVKADM